MSQGGGGGNPFAALGNMGNIMENVKKAQQLVQVEAAKAQEELAAYVTLDTLHRLQLPARQSHAVP